MNGHSSKFRVSTRCFSKKKTVLLLLSFVLMLASILFVLLSQQAVKAAAGDWPSYLNSTGLQGFNGAETVINARSASHLKLHWTDTGGGAIFSQPVEANGAVYWGSVDGHEYATDLSGRQLWQQYIGQTTPNCGSRVPLGVISTATVTTVSIKGTMTSLVLVGGGDANFYALQASSGVVLWKTALGAPSSNTFIWDSPVVYNGSAYIGIASIGDCPLVQGQVFQMNVTTGAIEHIFNVVPNGCLGGGIWGSPTIDQHADALYFATGNPYKCSMKEPYTIALVKLRASDLTFISSWQVPQAERTKDSDFGSTPTLFNASIHGTARSLVGVANKNGVYYAFDSTAISNGPVWKANIASVGYPNGYAHNLSLS